MNEFLECAESPLPGKTMCSKHDGNKREDTVSERLDFGVMTRHKRKLLGLNVDTLTSSEGCRKVENITRQSHRSKTAGMIYCYR